MGLLELSMGKLLLSCWILAVLAASPALAITLGQVDDFQDGTTEGWSGGASPTNVATGGPAARATAISRSAR